jgi:hypothetical protein
VREGVGIVVDPGLPEGTFRAEFFAPIAAPRGRRFMAGCGDCNWCMVTMMAWAATLPAQRYPWGVLASKYTPSPAVRTCVLSACRISSSPSRM